jgi:hypothetical protein
MPPAITAKAAAASGHAALRVFLLVGAERRWWDASEAG